MSNGRMGHKMFYYENKAYVFGGNDASYLKKCEVYDIQKDEWSQLPEMKQPLSQYSGQIVQKKIYLFGGFVEPNLEKVSNVFECFDIENNKWEENFKLKRTLGLKKECVFPLAKSSCLNYEENLFIFGGGDGENGSTSKIYTVKA